MPLERALKRAREIAVEIAAPEAEAVDRDGRWPEASLRALQEVGLGGLLVSERDGGLGLGHLALAQTCETLGAACGSTALCFGMHATGSAVLAAKPTPFLRQSYLQPIAAGEHLTTLALSEPGTGVHFYICEAEYRAGAITGRKAFITNGDHADSYVVSAQETDSGEFCCLVVDHGSPEMEWQASWEGCGMRGNASRSLTLKATPVGSQKLLGRMGDHTWYVFQVITPYFLNAMAGTYLGLATAALERAVESLSARQYSHAGGGPGDSSVIHHRVGCLWGQVERTRRLTYWAATQAEQGDPGALPALLSAKAEAADCAVQVANEAMTLMGGRGYVRPSPLERILRDARAGPVMSPTTDLLRIWTGRNLLGLPLLGE
jgi:alkylation response protein AidB-like acyl-CoA dehydrogenase